MNKKTRDFVIIGMCICGLLSACNFPLARGKGEATPTPLSDEEILGTTVAQTLSVFQSDLDATASAPTAIPLPTSTPTENSTENSSKQSKVQSYSTPVCYAASVTAQSIGNYTKMDRNEEFTQTWTIVNAGTCTWNSDTELVFIDGTRMDGDSGNEIDTSVSSGGSISVSVDLTAPSSNGTYTGQWALQTDNGVDIVYLWVIITVDEDDDDFYVSSVSFSNAETYSGICPYTYTYKAHITTKGDGDVVYSFKYSDGSTSSSKTLEFENGETQTVSGSWTLNSSGSYWVKVYIDDPNNQTFGSAKLTLSCANPTNTPTVTPTPTVTTTPTVAPTETIAPTETTAPTAEPTTTDDDTGN